MLLETVAVYPLTRLDHSLHATQSSMQHPPVDGANNQRITKPEPPQLPHTATAHLH
jgi:hypothetical protein